MTPLKTILNELKTIDNHKNNRIQVPTESKCSITHSRETVIIKIHTLKNKLYVLYFKFNLFSVTKLTKKLSPKSTSIHSLGIVLHLFLLLNSVMIA